MGLWTEIFASIKEIQKDRFRPLLAIVFIFFVIYLTYSLIRAATESLFIHEYGGKQTPQVWFLSVVALSLSVFAYDRIQYRVGVKKLFVSTSAFFLFVFLVLIWGFKSGHVSLAYPLYIVREVYIILLVHLMLGFCNAYFSFGEAKVFYGPMGAIGGLGSTVGGFMVGELAKPMGTLWLLTTGVCLLVLPPLVFHLSGLELPQEKIKKRSDLMPKKAPVASLGPVASYVFFVLLIVALSQFVINITNHEFNIVFTEVFAGRLDEKSAYLGRLYGVMGLATFFIQLIIVPLCLTHVPHRLIHLAVPAVYMALATLGLGLGGHYLWSLALTFVLFKSIDYSLFSSSKEMLYFSLGQEQKFGAKYLTDMIVYRLAKALIALCLMWWQDTAFLNILLGVLLVVWMLTVMKIFSLQKSMESQGHLAAQLQKEPLS